MSVLTKKQDATPGIVKQQVKRRSQWRDVWIRLKRNKLALLGLIILTIMVVMALFAPQIAPYHYDDQDVQRAFQDPGGEFILGTDNLGRDIFSRIVYGARISLQVGIIAVGISAVLGGVVGSIAGYYGGRIDNLFMRVMDVLLAIPGILLAIAIAATLGPGMTTTMISVGVSGMPSFARVVRASVLSIRDSEYIEAARAINASNFRIIWRHILPNILAPVIVQVTLGVASAILTAASLSFLGMGVQPPVPEWGSMLSMGRQFLRDNPNLVTYPGIAIMLTIFSLNLLGDGLRDALDPRMKN